MQNLPSFILVLLICTGLSGCKGPVRSITFFTAGNCAECQSFIEGALTAEKGIHSAKWDFASSQLSVEYDPRKWDESGIQEKVAGAGFQTQFFDAAPAARSNLPECCHELINRKLERANPHSLPHE
ncbi:MAG: heavy metal-associated domain-containing protein [Bacteroidota bacterium]